MGSVVSSVKNGYDLVVNETLPVYPAVTTESIEVSEERKYKETDEAHEKCRNTETTETPITDSVVDTNSVLKEEPMDVENSRKVSHSAPSSPTRPKIFRSSSVEDKGRRGEEEFETASILVGLSQTKGPRHSEPQKFMPVNTCIKPGTILYPARYPFARVGAGVMPPKNMELFDASGKPVRFITQPSQEYLRTVLQHQHTVSGNKAPPVYSKLDDLANTAASVKSTPPSTPPPPPPDSPEAARREFSSDQPKRDIPRDDRTRQYLQQRINKEREKFRGKRSLSFTEEFDEVKNNTKRQAKRALMGPNPFNIGVQLPEDFLLRSDKRIFQATPALPRDVTRFFKQEPDQGEYQNGKGGSSTALDPYKTMRDLENFRKNTIKSTENKSTILDPYKSPAEIQSVVKGIQDMQTHSPNHISYDEMRVFSGPYLTNKTNNSGTISSTISVFSSNPGISSIHMPLQLPMRFPYAHPPTVPHTQTVRLPYSMPPESVVVSSGAKRPGRKPKENKYVLPQPSTTFPAMSRPPQIHLRTELSPGHQTVGVPILAINNRPHFIHPKVVAVNTSKFPARGPPPLQRAGVPGVHPSSTFFLPHDSPLFQQGPLTQSEFRLPEQTMSLVPIIPACQAPSNSIAVKSEPDEVKVKTEPNNVNINIPARPEETQHRTLDKKLPTIFADTETPKDSSGSVFRNIKNKDLKTDTLLGKVCTINFYLNMFFNVFFDVNHFVVVVLKEKCRNENKCLFLVT